MTKAEPGLIDALEDELEESGVDDDILDEIVHDIYSEKGTDEANTTEDPKAQEEYIDAALHQASEVNNRGFRSQVSVILTECGKEFGIKKIRAAIQDWKDENHADLKLT